ncbi:FadR/GntR family transcriptional regulator [Calidifontibacter indicus]|uniref:GntR family transcriptional regulator n=1 Tax=Calidifontibacter indicus TaxID=419650 RepID=A0A3D9UZR1_9MICO|nr:FadR/GntR family transcriptional regulator [Calidifontibacter indicus]REF32105.1 GntR family transcriptional regulator [Calidifontibacter indicus]
MTHVRRTGLVDQMIAVLRANIADGTWPVGSRIPTEPQLVDELGASRNTIREAVGALVQVGMLERRQGSGTYVVSDSEVGEAIGARLTQAEHRHSLELRLAIDVMAAELAARRRTDDAAAELLAVAERRKAALGDPVALAAADLELHRAVVRASDNPLLVSVYDSLAGVLESAITENVADLPGTYDDQHEALVAAIVARDPEAAANAARSFLHAIQEERS